MGSRRDEEERERRLAAFAQFRAHGGRLPRRTALPRGDEPIDPLITAEELRQLLRHEYRQPVVSLYLALTEARTTRAPKVLVSVFHSLRHEVLEEQREHLDDLTPERRRQLEANLGEIELVLREGSWKDAHSLVILKSGEELNRLVGVPVRTADLMVIDPDPHIAPLERVLEAHRKVLVVEVAKDSTRLWTTHMGLRRELGQLKDFVPSDSIDASRPGKVQRHRQTHLHWHLRDTARVAERVLASEGCDLLVLVGEKRVRALLQETLSFALATRVLATLPPAAAPELEREIEGQLARLKAEDEERAVDALGPLRARGRVAAGLEEVLDAANRFVVRRLLIADGASRPGFICRRHHYLALEPGRCPYCDRELRPVADVTEELVELAYVAEVDLLLVTERPELLEPLGGVAAALYSEERATSAAAAEAG